MSFTLHVASDILQEKVNVEIPFPSRPGIDALRVSCEDVFTEEMHSIISLQGGSKQRPSDALQDPRQAGIFAIGRMQIYDDDSSKWVDLVSATQIKPFDQLYAFPLDLAHICRTQRELPPPRPVTFPRGGAAAPPTLASSTSTATGLSPKFRGGAVIPIAVDGGGSAAGASSHRTTSISSTARDSNSKSHVYRETERSESPPLPAPSRGGVVGAVAADTQTVSAARSASIYVDSSNTNRNYNNYSNANASHFNASSGDHNTIAHTNRGVSSSSSSFLAMHHPTNAGIVTSNAPPQAVDSELVKSVFSYFDPRGEGRISAVDFANALQRFGILFSTSVTNDIFGAILRRAREENGILQHHYDGRSSSSSSDSSWVWSIDAFGRWAQTYPVIFASLVNRVGVAQKEESLLRTLKAKEASRDQTFSRTEQLRRELAEAEARLDVDRAAIQQVTEEIRYFRNKRAQEEEEEQPVLEKEVAVTRQRQALLQEERAFADMASRKGMMTAALSNSTAARSGRTVVEGVGYDEEGGVRHRHNSYSRAGSGAGERSSVVKGSIAHDNSLHSLTASQRASHFREDDSSSSQTYAAAANRDEGGRGYHQHQPVSDSSFAPTYPSKGHWGRGEHTSSYSMYDAAHRPVEEGEEVYLNNNNEELPRGGRLARQPFDSSTARKERGGLFYAQPAGVGETRRELPPTARGDDGRVFNPYHSRAEGSQERESRLRLEEREYSPPTASSSRYALQQSLANAEAVTNARAALLARN